MSRVIPDTYKQLAAIINEIDSCVATERETKRCIAEHEQLIERLKCSLEDEQTRKEQLLDKAKALANHSNLPFNYVEPEDDEWSSSDDWNSSSQYC